MKFLISAIVLCFIIAASGCAQKDMSDKSMTDEEDEGPASTSYEY